MKIDFGFHLDAYTRNALFKQLEEIAKEKEYRYAKVVGALMAAIGVAGAGDQELYDALERATEGKE